MCARAGSAAQPTVFKSVRGPRFAAAPTWTFSISAFYLIHDHPVHLPRGQRLESRASSRRAGRRASRQYRSSALCRSGPAPSAEHRPHPAGDHDDRQRVSQRGPVGQRVRRSRRMLQHSEPPMPSWSASAPTAWASPQIAPPSPPAQPVPGPVHPDHPHPRRGQQPGREQAARYRAGAGPAMEGQARHPVRVPAIPCPILVIG